MFRGVNFFAKLSTEIIKRRRAAPVKEKRDDFLDLLIEAAENEVNECPNPLKNDVTLVAQVILFLLAGFDTTGLTIALTIHFLAVNPSIQVKVREEIQTHLQKYVRNPLNLVSDHGR